MGETSRPRPRTFWRGLPRQHPEAEKAECLSVQPVDRLARRDAPLPLRTARPICRKPTRDGDHEAEQVLDDLVDGGVLHIRDEDAAGRRGRDVDLVDALAVMGDHAAPR